jgi:hypothetical protein
MAFERRLLLAAMCREGMAGPEGMVTPADTTDGDAAKEVLFRLRLMHPEITTTGTDSGYAGQLVTRAKKHLGLTLKTISRPKSTPGLSSCPGAG